MSTRPVPATALVPVPQVFAPVQAAERTARDRKKIRILFMCDYNVRTAAAVCDFINAFYRYSEHQVVIVSCAGRFPADVKMADFDVVVVHFSLTLTLDSYISPATRQQMAEFKGLKMLFIQDEYRFIDRTIDAIRQVGIDVVFTCIMPEQIRTVYPEHLVPGVHFEHILTGYVPHWLMLYKAIPLAKRKFDVTYRGRSYPAWHGTPGRDRVKIGDQFLKDAKKYKLKCDIRWDEKSRLYGAAWVEFLRQSKAQLCTESAIGVFDRDGSISSRTEIYVEMLYEDRYEARISNTDYNEIRDKFFKDDEGLVETPVISPRCLEAVAIRTLLVMYEGRYSDIFVPWRHYVPLKKDHSNMAEVVAVLKDDKRMAEIIANAYAEIAQNPKYSYKTLVRRFDDLVLEKLTPERQSNTASFHKAYYAQVAPFYFYDNPHSIGDVKVISKAISFARRVKQWGGKFTQAFR